MSVLGGIKTSANIEPENAPRNLAIRLSVTITSGLFANDSLDETTVDNDKSYEEEHASDA